MRHKNITTSITLLLLLLLPALMQGQEMIATISQSVETDFGLYQPLSVDITPQCEPYKVEKDFSNVINFHDFEFTVEELTYLDEYQFVISPRRFEGGTGYREIYDVYNECRDMNIPAFVTTDAVLHTFHLCFDYILMTIEKKKFIPDLNNLLSEMITITHSHYSNANEQSVQIALKRNLDFLITAKKLLAPSYSPPAYDDPLYDSEIDLIMNAQNFIKSPIFGYFEDYSQYEPRGHYTKSDSLKKYFRSMMWLGRMTFAADPKAGIAEPNLTMTRSAILLIQSLKSINSFTQSAFDIWESIYAPTVFFVGKSDDINFYQYIPIMETIYGIDYHTLASDDFADNSKLESFLTFAMDLEGPRIGYPFQNQGFRFMGQRFIPDSYIFSELTNDRIPDSRYFPYGLDATCIFGSELSYSLLEETGDLDAYPSYAQRLESLKAEFSSLPENQWAENIYWNWLYSLMPLLFPKGDGYPGFMQNSAWVYKELATALGSWTELRHDTILYAKQSGSWTGIIPNAIMQQGYVEPNPHLYARLASLSDYLITGLQEFDLIYDNFDSRLNKLRDLLIQLKNIAEKELTDNSLSPDDYAMITKFGGIIEDIVQFDSKYGNMGPRYDSEDNMPVIADVHTVGGTGPTMFLEEGVGYPICIYVISPVEGQLIITKGAVFSYYEFIKTGEPRLTDEAWRDMLTSNQPPAHPWWTGRYAAIDTRLINSEPGFHFWSTFDTYTLDVLISPDKPEIGDSITVSVTSDFHWAYLRKPELDLTLPDGSTIHFTDFEEVDNHYEKTLGSNNFSEGKLWLEINTSFTDFDYYDAPISYRTGLYLNNPTHSPEAEPVALPGRIELSQNYPNPFNASCIIHYSLPKAGIVDLAIYSITGKHVKTLEHRSKSAGSYAISWDGTNDEGKRVASGVYILSLKSGRVGISKRMVLLY